MATRQDNVQTYVNSSEYDNILQMYVIPHSALASFSICVRISSFFFFVSGLNASPKSSNSAILLTSVTPPSLKGHLIAQLTASSMFFTFRIHHPETSSLVGKGPG